MTTEACAQDAAGSARSRSVLGIAATGIALAMVVTIIRGRIAGALFSASLRTPVESGLKALGAAFHDLVFIAACTATAALAAALVRSERGRKAVATAFLGFCLLLFAIHLAHISVMKYLSKPFTYQWLYYSDFLGSLDAKQAVAANLTGTMLALALAAAGLFLLLRLALRIAFASAARRAGGPVTVGALIVLLSAVLGLSYWELGRQKFAYAQTAQPIVAFVESLRNTGSPIYSQPTLGDVSDFVPRPAVPMRGGEGGAARLTRASTGATAGPVRNVIFFVMESAGAEFFGLYGSGHGATPRLDAQRPHSLVISDAYAHSPTTNMSLVALLTGTYPWTTERLVTSDYPDIRLPSISGILKERGYRTAFFNAADLRYQKAETFLSHRGFDVVSDYRSMQCREGPTTRDSKESFSTVAFEHLDGINDECAVDALNRWIGSVRADPFFAVFWSHMTHYPYMEGKAAKTFETADADLSRYLGALSVGDRALGTLLDHLKELGLSDSTLVVVLGDHGEAFGRHGDRVHGSAIYEDNVRIPLVFINPVLFSGEVRDTVGGTADIPPTVLSLLGLRTEEAWQGRSLLDRDRTARTYFFTPWSGLLLGYREGDMKYIYDALSGELEVYDIRADRFETRNLANEHLADRETIVSRIAGWVQYQDAFVRAAGAGRPKTGRDLAQR